MLVADEITNLVYSDSKETTSLKSIGIMGNKQKKTDLYG